MRRLLNQQPSRASALILSVLPFVMLIVLYLVASDIRLSDNPNDKLLPSPSSLKEAIHLAAFEEDKRTGEIQLWSDTAASLKRLLWGVAISAALGLLFGLATGVIPYCNAGLSPFIAVLSMIPPLAILPILFIVRELHLRVVDIPAEQIIKAQTLGASTWHVVLRVVLPQILPRLLNAVRLSLGPAWLFLIAAEAIAAENGLGYRSFLLRRYLAMDTILPYVLWITVLAFVADFLLRVVSRRLFPWANAA